MFHSENMMAQVDGVWVNIRRLGPSDSQIEKNIRSDFACSDCISRFFHFLGSKSKILQLEVGQRRKQAYFEYIQ